MDPKEREWRTIEFGRWLNTGLILPDGTRDVEGYRCDGPITYEKKWWLLPSVGIYDFHLNPKIGDALTYVLGFHPAQYLGVPLGTMLQPDAEFLTDKGSVPAMAHWAYERDRFLVWYMHDSMFLNRHVWMRKPDGIWFKFTVTRDQADMIMFFGIGAQDGNRLDRNFIYEVVHRCGKSVWKNHDDDYFSGFSSCSGAGGSGIQYAGTSI
jgi:hypothetical protein